MSENQALEALFKSQSMTYLHYDTQFYISFSSNQDKNYVLRWDGIHSNTLEIEKREEFMGDSNDCLFRVLPLSSFKSRAKVDGLINQLSPKKAIPSNMNKIKALEKEMNTLDHENYTRTQELQKLRGKFITFNTPIQFQHVISHNLEDSPSEDSLLKLLPSFKFQTENQKYVRFDQGIYISTHGKQENFFMHVSTEEDERLEGRVPTEKCVMLKGHAKFKSKLELKLNMPSVDPSTKDSYLFYGDAIWLLHAEHLAQLLYSPTFEDEEDSFFLRSRGKIKGREANVEIKDAVAPISPSKHDFKTKKEKKTVKVAEMEPEEAKEEESEKPKKKKISALARQKTMKQKKAGKEALSAFGNFSISESSFSEEEKGKKESLDAALSGAPKKLTGIDLIDRRSKDLSFQGLTNTNQENIRALWKIEARDQFQGGIVKIGSIVRLRHLPTGLYLVVKKRSAITTKKKNLSRKKAEGKQDSAHADFGGIDLDEEELEAQYFSLERLSKGDKTLCDFTVKGIEVKSSSSSESSRVEKEKTPVNIDFYIRFYHSASETWFLVKKQVSQKIGEVQGTSTGFMVPYCNKNPVFEDMYKIQKASIGQKWEAYFLLSTLPVVKYSVEFFKEWSIESVRVEELRAIKSSIKNLLLFCYDYNNKNSMSPTAFGLCVSKKRQRMLFDQRIVPILSELIKNILKEPSQIKILRSTQEGVPSNSHRTKGNQAEYARETIYSIVEMAYELLTCVIHENDWAQTEAFEFIHIYLDHVGLRVNALECISAIVASNERLQNLLRESKRNTLSPFMLLIKNLHEVGLVRLDKVEFIDLLRHFCTVKNVGLTPNQLIILSVLQSPELIQNLFLDLQLSPAEHSLSCRVNSEQLKLDEMFTKGKLGNPFWAEEIKRLFFQVLLMSALCLGRNYKARSYITSIIPFSVVLKYIWKDDLPEDLRGVLVHLATHCHIDSKPHSKKNLRKLIGIFDHSTSSVSKAGINVRGLLFQSFSMKKSLQAEEEQPGGTESLEREIETTIEVESENIGEEVNFEEIVQLNARVKSYFEEFQRNPRSKCSSFEWKLLSLMRLLVYFDRIDFTSEKKAGQNKTEFSLLLDHLLNILTREKGGSDENLSYLKQQSMVQQINLDNLETVLGYSSLNLNTDSILSQNESLARNEILRVINLVSQSNLCNNFRLSQSQSEVLCKQEILKMFLFVIQKENLQQLTKFIHRFSAFTPSILSQPQKNWDELLIKELMASGQSFLPEIGGSSKVITQNDKKMFQVLLSLFLNNSDFDLKYLSLKVLFRCYRLRIDFMRSLKKFLLVFSESEQITLLFLQKTATQLSTICEESESWMAVDESSQEPKNNQKIDAAITILNSLTHVMYDVVTYSKDQKDLDLSRLTSGSNVSYIRQKMLKYLRVPHAIIQLLRDGGHILEKINQKNLVKYQDFIFLFKSCYKFLALCTGNNRKLTKKLIYSSLNLFMVQLSLWDVGQSALLTSLVRNDCSQHREFVEKLISDFTRNIMDLGRKYPFMKFLKTTLTEFEDPLQPNQRLLTSILFNQKNIVHFFFLKKSQFNENVLFMDLNYEENSPDHPYLYHKKLFEVLVILIESEDQSSNIIKNRVAKYFPLDNLLDIVLEEDVYSIQRKDFRASPKTFLVSKLKPAVIQLITKLYVRQYVGTLKRLSKKITEWLVQETEKVMTLSDENIDILRQGGVLYLIEAKLQGASEAPYNENQVFDYSKYLVRFLCPFLLAFANKISSDTSIEEEDLPEINAVSLFVQALVKRLNVCKHYIATNKKSSLELRNLLSFFNINEESVKDEKAENNADVVSFYESLMGRHGKDESVGQNELVSLLSQWEIPFKSFLIFESDSSFQTKKQQLLWKKTVLNLLVNGFVKKEIELERAKLLNMFLESENSSQMEQFLMTLMDFISLAMNQDHMIPLCNASLSLLNDILQNYSTEQEQSALQETFNSNNVTITVLKLISRETLPSGIYSELVNLLIGLLDGGNRSVQETIYYFFISNIESERFFYRISHEIQTFIDNNTEKSSNFQKISESLKKIPLVYHFKPLDLSSVLRLLQLLCEGHYSNLQNYMRNQTKSRLNFNMILLIVRLIENLLEKLSAQNYELILQSFDSIIEFIQGPCPENQMGLIETKFLDICSTLLGTCEEEDRGGEEVKTGRISRTIADSLDAMSSDFSKHVKESLVQTYRANLEPYMSSRIKYKICIALEALIEGQKKNMAIIRCISREISITNLRFNLIKVYNDYWKKYKNSYLIEAFNKYSTDPKTVSTTDGLEIIIETGFKLFNLLRFLMDVNLSDPQDSDVKELIQEVKKEYLESISEEVTLKKFFEKSILSTISDTSIFQGQAKFAKIHGLPEPDENNPAKNPFIFFHTLTAEIDVVRDGKIEKIFFPILPYCLFLSQANQVSFHEKVNRFSMKTKHSDLVDFSLTIIRKLKRDELIRTKYGKSLMDIFFKHYSTWKNFSFYLMCFINLIILCSMKKKEIFIFDGYSHQPPYNVMYSIPSFEQGPECEEKGCYYDVEYFLLFLLVLHFVAAGVSLGVYCIKYVPILLEKAKREINESRRKKISFLAKSQILLKCFADDHILTTTTIYFLMALASLVEKSLISLLLLEFVNRSPLLWHVIQSIWRPKKQICLTILMVIVFIYYFSVVSILYFRDDFSGTCTALFDCFWLSFDHIFKYDGGIGGYLYTLSGNTLAETTAPRLLYDFTYNLFVLILIMEMLAGVIIDTFAELRDEEAKRLDDMTNVCFICINDRDAIDKKQGSSGFFVHTTVEHNMWNYLFYIAYLKEKGKTELSGIESYIFEKINNKDTSWFPTSEIQGDGNIDLKLTEMYRENFTAFNECTKEINKKVTKFLGSSIKNWSLGVV